MWYKAEWYLDFLFALRDNSCDYFNPKNYESLVQLKQRFDNGERTTELYDAIMSMT